MWRDLTSFFKVVAFNFLKKITVYGIFFWGVFLPEYSYIEGSAKLASLAGTFWHFLIRQFGTSSHASYARGGFIVWCKV